MDGQSLMIVITFALLFIVSKTNGETKRCYVCKSRGDMGDCKDSFDTEAGKANIQPCFTGWCMKTTDSGTESFPSTERSCMTASPSDNQARCAQAEKTVTGFPPKQVYLCSCYGDLCNNAYRQGSGFLLMLLCGIAAVFARFALC